VSGLLQGRVAIITGSASGLGRACAARMIAEGASVVIADIDHDKAHATAVALGPEAFAAPVDVSNESSVAAMVDAVIARFGTIDIVHNNAAELSLDVFGRDNGVIDMDVDVWDKTMAVNLRGPMLVCKHTIPHMLAAGRGAIVNTSSMSGLLGEDTHLAYASSKAALLAFTRHVANMHGREGIRCNVVAPGLMLTDVAIARLTPRQLAAFSAERLLPDAARPEDVANLVVFLASDQASRITGQCYVIDAGTQAQRPRSAMRRWEQMLADGTAGT
jgi:NAD(P)-dependent dehydrogenase (short-subunit alcohol dehydrogenase family)